MNNAIQDAAHVLTDKQRIEKALMALYEAQTRKGHSPRTKKNYRNAVILLLRHVVIEKSFKLATLNDYFFHIIEVHKFSARTVNLHQDAMRYFCDKVIENKALMYGIRHMKTNKPMPRVHSKEEIYAMIDATKNPKHRLLLSLAYGCGLRVNEIVHARVADFNWFRMMLRINDNAKGEKHREIPLFDCKKLFDVVTHGQGLLGYVFTGQFGGNYSVRSAEKDYAHACERIGINPTGFHTLRHSYITHLLEGGTNTKTVADLVGHSSVQTTEGYAHLSRKHFESVKSPMADFDKTEYLTEQSEVKVG